MNEPIRAFVALPFEPAILEAFRRSLVPLLEECGFSVRLPDATDHHRSVLKDIVTEIAAADVVVVDLTSSNPNVLYEAGVAHGLQKPVLCCTQDASRIPYDLQGYRAIVYPTGEWDAEARERIGNTLRAIAKRRTMLSGPVTDHVLRRIYEPAGSSFDRIAEFLNTELILYAQEAGLSRATCVASDDVHLFRTTLLRLFETAAESRPTFQHWELYEAPSRDLTLELESELTSRFDCSRLLVWRLPPGGTHGWIEQAIELGLLRSWPKEGHHYRLEVLTVTPTWFRFFEWARATRANALGAGVMPIGVTKFGRRGDELSPADADALDDLDDAMFDD